MTPEQKQLIIIVTCTLVLGLVGGAGIGWALKPDVVKVEEKVKVVEVTKEVVVVQEKVRVEIVKVKDTQIAERYRKTEDISPDGTIHRTEERNIDTVVKEKENSVEVKVVEVEKQVVVDRVVDRVVKIDPVLAQWSVGADVGIRPTINPLVMGPIPFGVFGEKRLAGPVWLGLRVGTTNQFNTIELGLKARVEF